MSNNDEQMRRFLFAILKQKSLKDIDWNLVAKDPVLLQPISNGHAARMRYSRFRQQMLGVETQKRNRNSSAKEKGSKSKKEDKSKRHSEGNPSLDDPNESLPFDLTPDGQIKSEYGRRFSQNQYTPVSLASPSPFSSNECPSGSTGRLPTPCSDDQMPFQHALDPNYHPPSLFDCYPRDVDMPHFNNDGVVDFVLGDEDNSQHSLGYTRGSWAHDHFHSAFDATIDAESY